MTLFEMGACISHLAYYQLCPGLLKSTLPDCIGYFKSNNFRSNFINRTLNDQVVNLILTRENEHGKKF